MKVLKHSPEGIMLVNKIFLSIISSYAVGVIAVIIVGIICIYEGLGSIQYFIRYK